LLTSGLPSSVSVSSPGQAAVFGRSATSSNRPLFPSLLALLARADTGAQPLLWEEEKLALCVNGEIYNHLALRKGLQNQDAVFKTHSDCEVIMHLVRPRRFILRACIQCR
jgi:hypothetical protein